MSVTSDKWKKQNIVLTATANATDAVLAIVPQNIGKYGLDMISLFPQKTFKGRKNGLRADLAQAIADIHPRFVRFPGGCLAHGDGIDNIYDWKGSIGALEARKPMPNIWRYHQTRGLGYYEFFQFCEDINAEPLPVIAAGIPCQNSGQCSHHSKDEITCAGQQGGIPMEEMGAYIQDILDLIEYANGDAKKTKWGKIRAQSGHPKPFNMKFIGIGNEDMITDVFEERFTMIYKAIKEKYPEITVIGTTGPFSEGTDYEEGWALATQLGVPMVDEHYYKSPGWFINHQNYYDYYDRNKPQVYLGEYAAHLKGGPNLETALAEALYLASIERNADIVTMTSYAPLLAKEGRTQWATDLIYFNNTEIKPSAGYYVLAPYAQGIKQLDDVRDTVKIESILTTSDQAYSKTDLNSNTIEKEDGDVEGPFDLGVSITESLDDDKETQIVYYSTSNLMDSQTNQMVSGGNEKLIMESLKWMTDTEESASVSIPSKSLEVSYLTITDYDAAFWKICTIALIPGIFLVIGFVVWIKRRKA